MASTSLTSWVVVKLQLSITVVSKVVGASNAKEKPGKHGKPSQSEREHVFSTKFVTP